MILIIVKIGSVESTVSSEETTNDLSLSHTINKVSGGGGGTLVVG